MELKMNIRKTVLALTFAAVAAPAAFANNFIGGEAGYDTHPVSGAITREQLQREYQAFRSHPVLADGTVVIQGEAGYVSPAQGAFVDKIPARPHSHVMGNNAAPVASAAAAPRTEAERRAYREQYIN
jgi:hypothetical protein